MSLLGVRKPLVDEAVTTISSSDTRGFPLLFYALCSRRWLRTVRMCGANWTGPRARRSNSGYLRFPRPTHLHNNRGTAWTDRAAPNLEGQPLDE